MLPIEEEIQKREKEKRSMAKRDELLQDVRKEWDRFGKKMVDYHNFIQRTPYGQTVEASRESAAVDRAALDLINVLSVFRQAGKIFVREV